MTRGELLERIEQKKDELLNNAQALVESGKPGEELESYFMEQLESFTKEIVKDKDFDRILEEMQEDAHNIILNNPDPLTSLLVLKLLGEHSQLDLSTLNQDLIKGLSSVLEKPLCDKIDDVLYGKNNCVKTKSLSDDFKKFENEYLEKEKDEILSIYDRHAGLVDGAEWQREKIMKDAIECPIVEHPDGYVFFDLRMSYPKDKYKAGNKVKVIVIKQEEE